jgi:hypothetical protein
MSGRREHFDGHRSDVARIDLRVLSVAGREE